MHGVRELRGRLKGHRWRVVPLLQAGLLGGLLAGALTACRGPSPDRALEQQRQQQQARLQQQLRCERQRRALQPLVDSFQQHRATLLAIDAEVYGPSPGPKPLDPEEQRRLAIYDQEIEQEQYEKALAAWKEREAQRYRAWRSEQAARRAAAHDALAAAAAKLRAIAPAVVSSSDPPGLRQAELQPLLRCRPEQRP